MSREGISNYEEILKCQVLDKYNLTDTKVPTITIKGGHIRFNMQAIHLLEDTPYIEILINSDEKYMLVIPCKQHDVFAVDWCRIVKKTGKVASKEMRSKYLSPKLYNLMDWNTDYSYKVQCFYQEFDNGKCLLFFDLTEYVTLVPTTVETLDGKKRKRTKPYYLADWQDSFGPPLQKINSKVNQDFMAYYVASPNDEKETEQMEVFEHSSTNAQNEQLTFTQKTEESHEPRN